MAGPRQCFCYASPHYFDFVDLAQSYKCVYFVISKAIQNLEFFFSCSLLKGMNIGTLPVQALQTMLEFIHIVWIFAPFTHTGYQM